MTGRGRSPLRWVRAQEVGARESGALEEGARAVMLMMQVEMDLQMMQVEMDEQVLRMMQVEMDEQVLQMMQVETTSTLWRLYCDTAWCQMSNMGEQVMQVEQVMDEQVMSRSSK